MYSYLAKVVTEPVHTLEDYINVCLNYGKPTTLIVLSSPVERKPINGTILMVKLALKKQQREQMFPAVAISLIFLPAYFKTLFTDKGCTQKQRAADQLTECHRFMHNQYRYDKRSDWIGITECRNALSF